MGVVALLAAVSFAALGGIAAPGPLPRFEAPAGAASVPARVSRTASAPVTTAPFRGPSSAAWPLVRTPKPPSPILVDLEVRVEVPPASLVAAESRVWSTGVGRRGFSPRRRRDRGKVISFPGAFVLEPEPGASRVSLCCLIVLRGLPFMEAAGHVRIVAGHVDVALEDVPGSGRLPLRLAEPTRDVSFMLPKGRWNVTLDLEPLAGVVGSFSAAERIDPRSWPSSLGAAFQTSARASRLDGLSLDASTDSEGRLHVVGIPRGFVLGDHVTASGSPRGEGGHVEPSRFVLSGREVRYPAPRRDYGVLPDHGSIFVLREPAPRLFPDVVLLREGRPVFGSDRPVACALPGSVTRPELLAWGYFDRKTERWYWQLEGTSVRALQRLLGTPVTWLLLDRERPPLPVCGTLDPTRSVPFRLPR